MELSLFDRARRKRTFGALVPYTALLILLHAVILSPLYLWSSSDVILAGMILDECAYVLSQVCNYLFYLVSFATLLFCVSRFGWRESTGWFFLYAAAVVIRYGANLLSSALIGGFVTWESFTDTVLPYLLLDVAFDLILMGGLAVLFILLGLRRARARFTAEKKENLFFSYLPFDRLFDFKNPLLLAAALLSLIPGGVQILERIYYDISYGMPSDAVDLLWMVLYYLSDLFCIALGYFFMVLLLNRFFLKEARARAEYNATAIL